MDKRENITKKPLPNGEQAGSALQEARSASRRRSRLAAIIAIFLLLYIPSTFNWFTGKSVATDILRDGALFEAYQAQALIVRDEELLFSTADGVSIPSVNDGERVPGKSAVATIYGRMSFELMDELKKTNRELLKEQYETLGRNAVFSQEVESIEKDISGVIRKMIPEINHNSLYDASQRTKAINGLVLKRADVYSSLETDDPHINQLKQEKRSVEDEVAQASSVVYSVSPGHFTCELDGNEAELTPEGIGMLTVGRFDEILNKTVNNRLDPIYDAYGGFPVKEGAPFAKIIKGNSFYFVIKAPFGVISRFTAGDRIRIRTETPYREIENAKIVAISVTGKDGSGLADAGAAGDAGGTSGADGAIYESDGEDAGGAGAAGENAGPGAAGENAGPGEEGLITIRVTKYLFDFLNARTVNVALVEKNVEGLKIPVKCLCDINIEKGEANIILLKGSHASIRKVRLLAANDVYAIIESYDSSDPEGRVSRYDTYVRDTANIEDGMMMSK